MLSTLAAIVFALVAGISPANAAISHTTAGARPAGGELAGRGPLVGAACLVAVVWGLSALAAARRDAGSSAEG